MPRIALYPGSFDPVTNGHLDVVQNAVGLCDRLIVAIGVHPGKKPLFSTEERLDMARAVFAPIAAKAGCAFDATTYDNLTVTAAQKAGATIMSPVTNGNITAFVRNGITIKEPKDFVGKKVGAPGLNAFLQVLFVKWLVEKGVDPKGINFVEVTFPTMSDIIKSGGVDAVCAAGKAEGTVNLIEIGRASCRERVCVIV